jgi:4-hydroxy-2-oxoheptanedioate aldolase
MPCSIAWSYTSKPTDPNLQLESSCAKTANETSAIHAAQHHSEGQSLVIVRVPKHDEVSLTTALDAGAAGIVIPHCESAEEVEHFKKEAFFGISIPVRSFGALLTPTGPIGQRSFSPWNFTPGLAKSLYPNDPYNVATALNHVCIIPQIESVKGMANVEEIAAVPGISAIMFGPGDYMIDAGLDLSKVLSGTPEPAFLEAMGKFGAAAAKNNVPIFGGAMTLDMIPSLIQSGHRAIAVQFDVWGFSRLVDSSLKEAKAYAKQFESNPSANIPNGQAKPE